MIRSKWVGLGIALIVMSASAASFGNVVVTLKNGVKISVPVPVKEQEIRSITVEEQGKSTRYVRAEKQQAGSHTAAPTKAASSPSHKPDRQKARFKGLPSGAGFRRDGPKQHGAVGTDSGPRVTQVFRIGPGKDFERPSEIARRAGDGDTIEIEPGLYLNDYVVWKQNNLTLRGVNGRPHLKAQSGISNRKGIWVIKGNNVVIENIEFSGAKVADKNGAGIRAEGRNLTVRNAYFHHNQFGILTANNKNAELTVENSEFAYQLRKGTFAHGLYVGRIRKAVIKDSYFHHNHRGHHLKSRAAETYILHNRITDEDGISSYQIDLPNCGKTYVIGNVLHQGAKSENRTSIAYGAEGCGGGRNRELYVINNTFVNDASGGTYVNSRTLTPVVLENNLMVGRGKLSEGAVKERNNLLLKTERFANRASYDFRLVKGASAINAGVEPGQGSGYDLLPRRQYSHPLSSVLRKPVGKVDVGAYEYSGD